MRLQPQDAGKKTDTSTVCIGKFYDYFLDCMFGQLKQAIFLAGFGLICCIFIFFVPFGSKKSETSEAQS